MLKDKKNYFITLTKQALLNLLIKLINKSLNKL